MYRFLWPIAASYALARAAGIETGVADYRLNVQAAALRRSSAHIAASGAVRYVPPEEYAHQERFKPVNCWAVPRAVAALPASIADAH